MKLIIPDIKYKDSFLAALQEFHAAGLSIEILDNLNVELLRNNFDDYVNELIAHSKGQRLSKGWVAGSTFWIIDDDEIIGVLSLRHELIPSLEKYGGHVGYAVRPSKRRQGYATKALKMLLPIASKLGIKKLLVTPDANNIASIKVIESNGGILQDEIQNEGTEVLTRRYWMETHR
ncbi:MAG: GNAT family N-acetyltransferase [Planctomycetota bacterium]